MPFIVGASIAFIAVLATQGGVPPSGEAGPPTCADSFATFSQGTGHWEGSWDNGFGGGGPLSLDVTIKSDCTLEATIDGVFGQPGPITVNATYRDENDSTVVDIVGDPIFGDTTITVTGAGALTVSGTGLHQSIENLTGTGTVTVDQIDLDITLTFQGGGTADETVELTRQAEPTPVPTSSPTPTPSAWARLWGDVDCSNTVDPVDSLDLLRSDVGLEVTYLLEECPVIGGAIPASVLAARWGDLDCSGQVNPVDSLKTLRFDAGLSVDQAPGCPVIGSPY